MGCFKTDETTHYLSGGLGVWAQGLALQIGAGGVMFFTGYKWGGLEDFQKIYQDISISNGWKMMEVMGMLHVVMAFLIAICVLSSTFVSRCFACVLYIINFLNSLYCLAATIGCGYYLNRGYSMANNRYEHLWDSFVPPVDPTDPIYQLYILARGRLLLGAVFSLCALAPFSRASTVKVSDPAPETILYVTSLILCCAIGTTLLLPTDITSLLIIGGVWIAVTVVVGLVNSMLGCCSKSLAIGALGVVFICIAGYGIVSGALVGGWYERGRDVVISVSDKNGDLDLEKVKLMKEDDRSYFLMFEFTDSGSYLLAAMIVGFGQFIVALFAGVYSLRFVCGGSRDEMRSDSKQY